MAKVHNSSESKLAYAVLELEIKKIAEIRAGTISFLVRKWSTVGTIRKLQDSMRCRHLSRGLSVSSQKIARQYEIQLFARIFVFFTSLEQGVQHLQCIVHWSFAINIWFSGISAMYNKEFHLKSLPSIGGNMKWGVTSILWRQGTLSWSKGCQLSYSNPAGLKTCADFSLHTIK